MIQELLVRFGIGYVRLDGSEEMLWAQAARHAPIPCRLFRRSILIDELDFKLKELADWHRLKSELLPDDLIWPFTFNRGTSAMRAGYVVIRSGKPVTGIVTTVS